jgi:hypothetical protein
MSPVAMRKILVAIDGSEKGERPADAAMASRNCRARARLDVLRSAIASCRDSLKSQEAWNWFYFPPLPNFWSSFSSSSFFEGSAFVVAFAIHCERKIDGDTPERRIGPDHGNSARNQDEGLHDHRNGCGFGIRIDFRHIRPSGACQLACDRWDCQISGRLRSHSRHDSDNRYH